MRSTKLAWIFAAAATTSLPATESAGVDLGPSRAELVHRWDLNKDGKIDESEAEVARAKMRRERLELQNKAATEKPLLPEPKKDEPDRDPLGEAFLPANPNPPQAAEKEPAKEPPKRDRQLNAGRPKEGMPAFPNAPVMRDGRTGGGQAAGGIITGGARAGAPALRPGYGVSGPKVDLNAGRLPAGLPPAQGMRPQVGSAPFRSGTLGTAPRGTTSRPGLNEPARLPLAPSSPARVSAEDIGL